MNRYAITTGGVYNHSFGEWVKASDFDEYRAAVEALVGAANDCIDSLKYVEKINPDKMISGYGVRLQRIEKTKQAIAAVEALINGGLNGQEKRRD